MKTLIFDVMLNEQYIHTFKYKYNPLFPIEEEELRKFVEERLPTLKGKKFKILFQGMNLNAIIKKWFCRHECELMYERKVTAWDELGCNKYIARYYVCKKCGRYKKTKSY